MTLVMMYATPAWAVAVLIFIQDGFRAEAMQEPPATPVASAIRLGLLGLLSNAIALAINPVVTAVSLQSLLYLSLAGALTGLACGGLLWPALRHRQADQADNPNTIKTTTHG